MSAASDFKALFVWRSVSTPVSKRDCCCYRIILCSGESVDSTISCEFECVLKSKGTLSACFVGERSFLEGESAID